MTLPGACVAEIDVDAGQLRPWPDNLSSADPEIEPPKPRVAPACTTGSVSQLSHGDKRDEDRSASQEWLVRRCKDPLGREEIRSEDTGVCDYGPSVLSRGHACVISAQKASASSSDNSSITMSSCAGKGRPRRSNSSRVASKEAPRGEPSGSGLRCTDTVTPPSSSLQNGASQTLAVRGQPCDPSSTTPDDRRDTDGYSLAAQRWLGDGDGSFTADPEPNLCKRRLPQRPDLRFFGARTRYCSGGCGSTRPPSSSSTIAT